ncbi:MAG: archease [Methanobacterium sp.]
MKYEFFDVTADVGYKAYGKTLEESFENAALALFEVMTNTSKVKCIVESKISIESEDLFALLFDWLSELIFLHDSEFLVFSRFKVKIVKSKENYRLNAVVCGEAFDLMIHESREDVKAATYHLMDIKEENGYMVQVILDT